MTREEAIKTIEVAIAEVEWEYPMDYAVAFETAIKELRGPEVVRCQECEYYKPEEYFSPCVLPQGIECAKPNDFCSYGERKDGAE